MSVASNRGVTRASGGVQAPLAQAAHAAAVARAGIAVGLTAWLAGCASIPTYNPVNWWHGLEGGPLADARPPPPNADAPYPNLASVPAKPPPPDATSHATLARGLVADRANAKYAASVTPLVAAPAVVRHAPASAVTGGDEQPNASLQAANAPPPRAAPVQPVSAEPLAAAAAPAPPNAPVAKPAAPVAPPAAEAMADTPMPTIPAAPPAPPALPGLPIQAVVPTPALAAPPPPVVPPKPGEPVAIPFASGSAELAPEALAPIRSLVQRRGGATIAVTGFGDATVSDADAQAAALPLGLARARAVATDLQALGVPAASIRISAEAQGSGAAARIAD